MQNLRHYALLAGIFLAGCHGDGSDQGHESSDGQGIQGVIKAGSAFKLDGQSERFKLSDYSLFCTAFGLPAEVVSSELTASGAFSIDAQPGRPFTCDLRHKASQQIFAVMAAEQTYASNGAHGTTALTSGSAHDLGDLAIGTDGVLLIEKTRLDPAQELAASMDAVAGLLAVNKGMYTIECGEVTPELMAACNAALKAKVLPKRIWLSTSEERLGELTVYRLGMHETAEGPALMEGEVKSSGNDWSLLKLHSQTYQDGCVIHRWRDLAFIPHPIALAATIGIGEVHENCGSKLRSITRFNVRLVRQPA